MIKVASFTFNPFAENTFVLSDETGEAIIIDPGCYDAEEKNMLSNYIEKQQLKPVKLILTHAHIDHILGNNYVSSKYNLGVEMHADDVELLLAAPVYGQVWGIQAEPSPGPSNLLKPGEFVNFGQSELEILFTPGHSKGSISFYSKQDKFAVVGDVLFNGSIGRTDLPGGNHSELIKSIREKLLVLGDEVRIYCGHGPETTIGHERKHNPFLQD
ncbi:MAG TPA: MBL fold metallo-hydrolase [Bacteroidia bacterium]|nr:MBL fold metallo-hydrolase [Bacteroidia bacterium]HNS13492.1 MBL fold metallo-hydrolase [Bacteroidia bacterium]